MDTIFAFFDAKPGVAFALLLAAAFAFMAGVGFFNRVRN